MVTQDKARWRCLIFTREKITKKYKGNNLILFMQFFSTRKYSLTQLKNLMHRRLKEKVQKSQQHQEFPSGLPSKYCPGPMLLNFSDRTRTGVFNMVWPLARNERKTSAFIHQQMPCIKATGTLHPTVKHT